MKKQFFIFAYALSIACNTQAFDQRYFFENVDGWKYLEKIFITDIYNAKNAFWAETTSYIPMIVGAVCGLEYYKHSNDFHNEAITKKAYAVKNLLDAENIYLAGMLISSGIIAHQYARDCVNAKINRQAVDDFFSNWEINSLYAPEELEDAFFMIAEIMEFNGKDAILDHADEIVEIIQFMITRHFESRYKKLLEVEAYNALGDAKTSIDLLKNIIGTAKDLTA